MKQISNYSLKVIQIQRILSDLNIVSNIASQTNSKTSNEIIYQIKIKENYHFIQQKQSQFNQILNQQTNQIQQLHFIIHNLNQKSK